MRDVPPEPLSRRRMILLGSWAAAACAAAGWLSSEPATVPRGAGDTDAGTGTLLAFIGALFGRNLSLQDRTELTDRLAYMGQYRASLRRDCSVLAAYLDRQAGQYGAGDFAACSASQKASIVDEVMRLPLKSRIAFFLSRFSRTERDFYRIRWSAVPQLAWVYRHSPAAWRARGYERWPGVRGNWRDILAPGAPYP
jgi:hypothetical protein